MCAAKLKEALNDCLINFDRRVLLTDLINEYHLPLEEVSRTLVDYLRQQEQEGVKYEKRFVVHGMEADDKEVFTIVKGEDKLQEWLNKLKDAESALYSVEVDGGARAPADDLKPVTWCAVKLDDVQHRKKGSKQQNGTEAKSNGVDSAVKVEIKSQTNTAKGPTGNFDKTSTSENAASDAACSKVKQEAASKDSKKVSPQSSRNASEKDTAKKTPQKSTDQKKVSPKDKKAAAAAASGQKGIGNFFASKSKGAAETSTKTTPDVTRQKSPKKLNDFFKKQAEKPAAAPKEALKQESNKANTSVQLFEEDEEDVKEKNEQILKDDVLVESSDEEEELNNLRRKVEDEDKKEAATCSRKRLRIEDSDDDTEDEKDEEPKHKLGKLEESAVAEEESPPKSEAFLDEDGFVITIKSKKAPSKSKTPTTTRSKTPTKANHKETKPKQTPAAAAKTKQGNIMNFFKKK